MPSRTDLANAIRALSMDAVQQANSGHPGAPMGMADMAEVLWNDFRVHNPANPHWINRDRFVLSNGHASMLQYSLLHLTGYDLGIDELKNFRQLHSKTAGHPEYRETPGVETTTGPLGQGLANAVGMAIAERTLGAQFNRAGHNIIDHQTYVMLGDGCLMEGISHEACSLAGTLKLGKLIAMYDDNGISIDGEVEGWFTDDTPKRFESYGWHVIPGVDGHEPDAITAAITAAKKSDQPTLICCKTTIGFGSPNKGGKESSHGAPLGADEIELARKQLGWNHAAFDVPADIYAAWNAKDKGAAAEEKWNAQFEAYQAAHPELAAELSRRVAGELPADWQAKSQAFIDATVAAGENIATRKASLNALNGYGPMLPELLGGSADLAGSNLTIWSDSKGIETDPAGNYIYYGVREFAMAAITNGIALHGGFKPYAATFLMFSEYARNALRMAALMQIQGIYVFTHDSIGLGEDGPTHQPVEQTATLRMMPNMSTWRPCDSVETAVAWKEAVELTDRPVSLILTRQGLKPQQRSAAQIGDISKGGYVLHDPSGDVQAILIATGSEVALAIDAAEKLAKDGIAARVVSMPSTDRFDSQTAAYKESVLPSAITARVAVEAGVTSGWYKYVGLNGAVLGLDRFGASAPADELFKLFGFTVENLVDVVKGIVASA
ncbi:MAG: transketolase [Granulosicoccaceae bacterium]